MQNKITTIQLSRALDVLKSAGGFMTAIELANKIGAVGSHELKRRHIRTVIKMLRDEGHWIIATLSGGYFYTKDRSLWKEYLDGRNIDAKRIIGEASGRKRVIDSTGQAMLFDSRVHVGCAVKGAGFWKL